MRSRFDEQLAQLNREMIEMGAQCEEVIALASKALTEADMKLAAKVAPLSADIDRKEREIEALCLRLLLQQQPVARDLRQISAALKMITDLERIGDQAEEIADIIGFIDGHNPEDYVTLTEMAKAAIHMVTESIDAYVKHDTILAEKVVDEDDIVDEYFLQVKSKLIAKIAALKDEGEYDEAAAEALKEKFRAALDNDLNTSLAVTALYDVLKAKTNDHTKLAVLADFDRVLSLDLISKGEAKREELKKEAVTAGQFTIVSESGESDAEVEAKIQARQDAKKAKNFVEADRIRDELKAAGIEVTDISHGAKWKRV